MNIYELADLIDQELVITRYPNENNRFSCSFDDTETKVSKEDSFLTSRFGDGKSPSAAVKDYARKIRGKLLVIGAMSGSRKEFQVPKNLRVI